MKFKETSKPEPPDDGRDLYRALVRAYKRKRAVHLDLEGRNKTSVSNCVRSLLLKDPKMRHVYVSSWQNDDGSVVMFLRKDRVK